MNVITFLKAGEWTLKVKLKCHSSDVVRKQVISLQFSGASFTNTLAGLGTVIIKTH